MNRRKYRRSFHDFVFGEDFSSWYVPEISKLEHLLNKEIRNGFFEAAECIRNGMDVEEAWDRFSSLHSAKHLEFGKRIEEARRLRLIIPFYSRSVLVRFILKRVDSRYAALRL